MPEYDGSIVIDSHIDTSNFDKDASKMFSKLKEISSKLDDALKFNSPLKEIGNNMKFSKELANASDPLKRLSSELERSRRSSAKLKSSFSGMGSVISNTFGGIGSMFTNTFAGIGKMFATITRRTQWILLGQTIRAVIADAKESIADLRTYNQDFDKSMQSIRDSFKNVGNAIATSFAPILQALAPIIANVASWLTELFNKITLFTTALFTGAKTAVIADTNFSGYAKSTKKATANTKKGTKAIKEQTNALAKFDKLDIFKQDKAKSPASGIADAAAEIPQAMNMFKTVGVPREISEFANKLKETFRPLGEEFKVIGDSFQKNFIQPVYKHVRENILPRFLDSTRERIAKMDFTKLNSSLDRFFSIMAKITINLFDGLEWGWENVLLPMIDKTITDYLPKFLDMLTTSLQILNTTWIMAKPFLKTLLTWLKELGDPFIQGALSGLKDALESVKTALEAIAPAVSWVGDALSRLHIPQGVKDFFYMLGRFWGGNFFNPFALGSSAFFSGITTGAFYLRKRIPGLASGTVVSPNGKFLAMLGDNTSEPEVVSPVSTMKQAFMEAMYETGMNTNNGNVVLQLDGTTFARLINPYTKSEQNRIGISMVEGVAY
jgi:hypothetical protein